eukprot:15454311-Alexandrium_andersonii.AAC.1
MLLWQTRARDSRPACITSGRRGVGPCCGRAVSASPSFRSRRTRTLATPWSESSMPIPNTLRSQATSPGS